MGCHSSPCWRNGQVSQYLYPQILWRMSSPQIDHFRHSFPFVYRQNLADISQNLACVCAAPFQFHVSVRMSERDVIDKHKTLPIVSCLKTDFIQIDIKTHSDVAQPALASTQNLIGVVSYNLTSNSRNRQKAITQSSLFHFGRLELL